MKIAKSLLDRITVFTQKYSLLPHGSTIVIGLSGGPDSVFLLHYLAGLGQEKGLTLIAAHLDHGWRAESGQDAQFCQELATRYQIPFILKHLKETHVSFKVSEEVGRKARRAFFEQVAKEQGAQAIALAHHADDQMETFFLRLIRGTSLTGLTGMKPKDGLYIRPLLEISKQEILDYLHGHQIPYVIDASNQSDEYLRNRIRNQVIPALKACDERFAKNFATTHAKLIETEEFLQEQSAAQLQEMTNNLAETPSKNGSAKSKPARGKCEHSERIEPCGPIFNSGSQFSNQIDSLDIQKLLKLHPVLRNRVLINWLITHKVPFTPSQGLLDEIVRFLENTKANKHTLYGKWRIIKINKQAELIKI